MIKVAITGGIGSGKSTVSKIIKDSGYKVISCDEVYNRLLCNGVFDESFSQEFGSGIFENGHISKNKLKAKVFNDKELYKKLNAITHPVIIENLFKLEDDCDITFFEVPLLFECGLENNFDKVIVVLRDKKLRIEAVLDRDKSALEEIKSIINEQYNYDNANFTKYYVIHNNASLGDLCLSVMRVIDCLKDIYNI